MLREWELAHAPQAKELERYRLALLGIASCSTQCSGCQMLADVAREALWEYRLERSSNQTQEG